MDRSSLLIALALVACDEQIFFTGVVTDATGMPQPEVEVALDCDAGRFVYQSTRTNEKGAFLIEGVGCVPLNCEFVVGHRGFNPSRTSVAHWCHERALSCARDTCSFASAQLLTGGGRAYGPNCRADSDCAGRRLCMQHSSIAGMTAERTCEEPCLPGVCSAGLTCVRASDGPVSPGSAGLCMP